MPGKARYRFRGARRRDKELFGPLVYTSAGFRWGPARFSELEARKGSGMNRKTCLRPP
jgi:hypothetical protein